MTPRVFRESVWCSRWMWCGGIGDPGYDGGGEAMLCVACEATRLARVGESPRPSPQPEEPARERIEPAA